jgi:hypothetical protein
MPNLVQGHVRFSDSDFLMNDYEATVLKKYTNKTTEKLTAMWNSDSEQFALMKDIEVTDLFDTQKNIKKILAEALAIVSVLAQREGYGLAELMRQ